MAINKNTRNKVIYKVLSGMTLILPLSITMVISAIWSKPTPDIIIMFDSVAEINKVDELSDFITFSVYDERNINTEIVWNNVYEINAYNVDFTNYTKMNSNANYIIKNDSYVRFIGSELDEIVEFGIEDGVVSASKVSNINVETGNKLSLAFVVSLVATAIVVLVITNKMRMYRKYPRTTTFISLLSITILLAIINAIIGTILSVFIVATVSWGAYCLEYYFFNNYVLEENSQEKKTSNLAKALREIDL